MGHVPGFTNAIFPAASIPTLTLVANVGLVLFLFLVGLEVDLRYFVINWRIAISVGALGMALPFGMGAAIAYGLYNQFRDDPGTTSISFGVYMLFVGVAMAITVLIPMSELAGRRLRGHRLFRYSAEYSLSSNCLTPQLG